MWQDVFTFADHLLLMTASFESSVDGRKQNKPLVSELNLDLEENIIQFTFDHSGASVNIVDCLITNIISATITKQKPNFSVTEHRMIDIICYY